MYYLRPLKTNIWNSSTHLRSTKIIENANLTSYSCKWRFTLIHAFTNSLISCTFTLLLLFHLHLHYPIHSLTLFLIHLPYVPYIYPSSCIDIISLPLTFVTQPYTYKRFPSLIWLILLYRNRHLHVSTLETSC